MLFRCSVHYFRQETQRPRARGETSQSLYYIYPFTIFGNF
nr:MAG TPA: hypothetical protein [Bacteriophage sp.]